MLDRLPLISRKIRVPRRRPHQVQRQRLLDLIHANIQNRLILVAAGAGYGKTSLLIDFAHDTELPVCWYSLDPSDNHPLYFIEYLNAAIHERFPDFGASIVARLSRHEGPAEDIDSYIRLFINEIEENTDDYFLLVLDDYHEVIQSEAVNALLDGILRYLPENCHILLASRGIPRQLTLTRLTSQAQAFGFGVEDLAFTTGEVGQVLAELGYGDLSAAQVSEIARRSEGWITGILLAAQSQRGGAAQELVDLTGASGGVFDFMAEQVLARQPDAVQQFMMDSAVLDEMTAPLLDALLGRHDSALLLRDLEARSLFIFSLDAERSTYLYHQLFREFLEARLKTEQPQRHRELSMAKAELLVNQGKWPQAISSLLSVRAYDEAADAIEITALETYNSRGGGQLAGWIGQLPHPVLVQHPRLIYYQGRHALNVGNLDEATEFLEDAHRRYVERGDERGIARTLVQQGVCLRLRGQLDAAVQKCRQALDLAQDAFPLVETQAHHNIGLASYFQSRFEDSRRELQIALQAARANGDDTNAAFVANDLATVEVGRGNLESARASYHQALLPWRRLGNPEGLAIALNGLGMVYHYLGQYADAEQHLTASIERALLGGRRRVAAYGLASRGDLWCDTGRHEQALADYDRARELAIDTRTENLAVYALVGQALAQRGLGHPDRAGSLLTEAMDQLDATTMVQERGLCRLAQGMLHFDAQQYDLADERLTEALNASLQTESVRDQGRTRIYLAAAAYRQGHRERVAQHLVKLFECVETLGSHQFIVAEGPDMLPLLQRAQEGGRLLFDWTRIRSDLAQLYPDAALLPVVQVVQNTLPLELLGLNGGRVLLAGEPVGGWETDTARVMAFLLAAYPMGLGRDRIIDLLWPETALSRGNSQFHTTLFRARRVLGKPTIVNEHKVYRLKPEGDYRYDVAEFERLQQLGQGEDATAHLARVQSIALYRTPFLESSDGEWPEQVRRSLELSLVESMIKEGRYQLDQGGIDTAEGLFLRTIAIDSLDERAHRGLMWCRYQRRDRAGALRQYERCVHVLMDELGEQPSSVTRQLLEGIRANQATRAML